MTQNAYREKKVFELSQMAQNTYIENKTFLRKINGGKQMSESLKIRVMRLGKRQFELAKELGRSEAWLSRILNGHRIPPLADRKAIAAAMKCSMKSLWPNVKKDQT